VIGFSWISSALLLDVLFLTRILACFRRSCFLRTGSGLGTALPDQCTMSASAMPTQEQRTSGDTSDEKFFPDLTAEYT
jgi:hypothetical protein